tara:strand:+ start:24465 stop:24755 length:291 start_codon:yes stop_codon:yes gene_type:complete
MFPVLCPADFIVVDNCFYKNRLPTVGEVVLALDPRNPDVVIVKRVSAVHLDGTLELLGDNMDESTDSRLFGPIAQTLILGRVRICYWPLSRFGYVR